MGHHVVQLPCDPGAFLQHGPPGPLQLGAVGLGGQGPLAVNPIVALSGPVKSARSLADHSHQGMRVSAHIHPSTGRR